MTQPSAADWGNPDPNKNMTLADADRLALQLSTQLGLQLTDIHVEKNSLGLDPKAPKRVEGAEVRGHQFMSPLALNLYGSFAGPEDQRNHFNLQELRSRLLMARSAPDQLIGLMDFLNWAQPGSDVMHLILNLPPIKDAIGGSLKALAI